MTKPPHSPLTREQVIDTARALFQHYGWSNPGDQVMRDRIERMRDMALASTSEKPAQLRAMQQCSRHQGIPITLKVGYAPAVATYCPNCEEEDAARR